VAALYAAFGTMNRTSEKFDRIKFTILSVASAEPPGLCKNISISFEFMPSIKSEKPVISESSIVFGTLKPLLLVLAAYMMRGRWVRFSIFLIDSILAVLCC
jgi:hypothetical protein